MPTRSPNKDINYLSKDFNSIKTDLIDYIKRQFPNEWRDFNDASGGMAVLELMAYVGDVLSFNIDRQVNEAYINRAVEIKNIVSLAENFGYMPRNNTPAIVNLSVSADFNTSTSGAELCKLKKGAKVFTNFEPIVPFEILNDVDFSQPANRIINPSVGDVTTVSISSVSAAAGTTKTFSHNVSSPVKFLKITLPDRNINEIVSVSATDGSEYYGVESLAKDTIFVGDINGDASSSGDAAFILKIKRVPKRYVTEREPSGLTSIRFGPGILTEEDSEVIPNPNDFVLPPTLRGSPSGFASVAIDSTNFLKTKSLGVAPQNTTMVVTYRQGGGVAGNVGPKSLTRFVEKEVQFVTPNFQSLSASVSQNIIDSISCTNIEQATGGEQGESIASIKINAINNMSSQMRCVTLQDYQVRVMAMPSQFGTIFRSFARKDPNNNLGVELVLITRNSNKQLTAPNSVIKNNVGKYIQQFKSFSDTVTLQAGRIINIAVNFTIVPTPDANFAEALMSTMLLLQRYFDVARTNFNDTIVISELVSIIQAQKNVLSVPDFKIINKVGSESGRTYSGTSYNTEANTAGGILTFGPTDVWELKYPNFDIIGRSADQATAAAQGSAGGGGY
tara:strand:- start:30 stop:1880 length:1851 start_codon:yes stop_codon:yes gene_type:complete